jgi:uncharacterized protein YheU (UPF0270 family)
MAGVIVPHHQLSAETLAAVVEEYVTRDGTELTDAGPNTARVVELLDQGELLLVYDADSESCNIVNADQAPALDGEDIRVDFDEDG